MTLAEQGAYRNLLDELWLRHGFLPNDERILAKIAGDASEWPKVRSAVLARFRLTTSGWRHDTHDEVAAFNYKQSRNGKARAEKAKRDETGQFLQNDQPDIQPDIQPKLHDQLQPPSPSPSLDLLITSVTPTNGTSVRTPLPPLLRKGGSRRQKRLTRAEIKDAERWREISMRPCEHEPRCRNYEACVERIAYEIRERRAHA